ncbi:hypothetical protein F0562_035624 [Nyssa sinensis]|uniref:Beta-glucosidase n=1 Tax=Nyssa sinensis TaxID=561372 RepID=A0A5J5AAT0_9ASTE|nr:hypothetical protein F0562_035624 [Nyssa sinensis]
MCMDEQTVQKGKIGIVLVSTWMAPFSKSSVDRLASRRALDFMLGWFLSPIVFGHYPVTMRSLVRTRLPTFSKNESDLVKGSFDFIGINYYTANYAAQSLLSQTEHPSYTTDSRVRLTTERNGTSIGQQVGNGYVTSYPEGIWRLLVYIKRNYNNPPILITENGVGERDNSTMPVEDALKDYFRIKYHYPHLFYVRKAIRDGVNLKGYIAWSILDNFEWALGYTLRYGINYVDYNNGLKRSSKFSATWFQNFLKK